MISQSSHRNSLTFTQENARPIDLTDDVHRQCVSTTTSEHLLSVFSIDKLAKFTRNNGHPLQDASLREGSEGRNSRIITNICLALTVVATTSFATLS